MTDSGSASTPAFTPLPGRSGAPIPIPGSSVRIGQGPQNDVVIDDDTVSTSHARLDYAEGSWRLSDLGSRNGTFVNGERIPSGGTVELPADAPVAFGGVKLVFAPGAGLPVAAAAAERMAPAAKVAEKSGPGFRLPVWVLLLIILVIAAIVAIVVMTGGAAEPVSTNVEQVVLLLGFQSAFAEL